MLTLDNLSVLLQTRLMFLYHKITLLYGWIGSTIKLKLSLIQTPGNLYDEKIKMFWGGLFFLNGIFLSVYFHCKEEVNIKYIEN